MSAYDRRPSRQRVSKDPVARYLGELQTDVMGILWDRGTATVREIAEEIGERRPIAYTTVLTIVSRLWTRGLLLREAEGRGFRYRPARTREGLLSDLSNELIDRLLNDFGEIAVAQLGQRLDALDPGRKAKLRQARKRA